jgi:hypothetical protein
VTGHHQELYFFYLTNLGKDSPLILGVPWLQLHNPSIDWPALKLIFSSNHCRHNCLSSNLLREAVVWALPKQISPVLKRYQPPSVKDCLDKQASPLSDNTPVLYIAGSLTLGQPHYCTHNPYNITGPECRVLMIPAVGLHRVPCVTRCDRGCLMFTGLY